MPIRRPVQDLCTRRLHAPLRSTKRPVRLQKLHGFRKGPAAEKLRRPYPLTEAVHCFFTSILPPCLAMICELIQSPRPVPLSPFELTNGSKRRFSDLRWNSRPVVRDSQTNARPRSIPMFMCIGDPDLQPSVVANGVRGISDQVQNHPWRSSPAMARMDEDSRKSRFHLDSSV